MSENRDSEQLTRRKPLFQPPTLADALNESVGTIRAVTKLPSLPDSSASEEATSNLSQPIVIIESYSPDSQPASAPPAARIPPAPAIKTSFLQTLCSYLFPRKSSKQQAASSTAVAATAVITATSAASTPMDSSDLQTCTNTSVILTPPPSERSFIKYSFKEFFNY